MLKGWPVSIRFANIGGMEETGGQSHAATNRDGTGLIEKIVSGGQTGVDRAALEFALERGISCGGWCPRGRLAEEGPIDERYPLKETPSEDYAQRTRWNVRDSDGTLILTAGEPTGGTALTKDFADTMGKPCFVVDLDDKPDAAPVQKWIENNAIRILNVAGPRASQQPEIYEQAVAFLKKLFG